MRPKPPAATILKWLKENEINLGALTSHDVAALEAAVQVANLWIRADYGHKVESAVAFYNVVMQMQPDTRYIAFHSIAHVGDWCHRWELWNAADLPKEHLANVPECAFGPGRTVITTAAAA